MINDIKRELERILIHSRKILRIEGPATEQGRSALQIEQSAMHLIQYASYRRISVCAGISR